MKSIFDKYTYDEKITEEFLNSFEINIGFNSISWKNILKKILVWDGFEMDRDFDYSQTLTKRKSDFFKSGFKLIKWNLSKRLINDSSYPISQDLVCFYLADLGEIDVLESIIEELKKRDVPFSVYFKENKQKRKFNGGGNIYKLGHKGKRKELKFKFKKWPTSGALYVFNRFIEKADEILLDIAFLKNQLEKNKKLKKIIFVAGENKFNANLFCEILKNRNVGVENLMNGAKIGWVHDRDIDFSRWYVWTDKMVDFLHQKAHNPIEKLEIVGHPLQDKISSYQYCGEFIELNKFKEEFEKVVSLFTSSIKFRDQINFYKEVIKIVTSQKDIGLVIKPHPSDRDLSYLSDFKNLPNLYFFCEYSKQSTLDLISISSYTISISSTLSFESVWMGIPNISFEQEESSFLPIDKSNHFYHINSLGQFQNLHQILINGKFEENEKKCLSITKKYVDLILE